MAFEVFRPVFSTGFFTLEEAAASEAGALPYHRVAGPDSVICVVLDKEDRFLMLQQYRPALGQVTLEMPAGAVENDELPLEAARREIQEEIGVTCPLLPLGASFYLMMNRTNIREYLFFGLTPEAVDGWAVESGTELAKISRNELLDLALKGGFLQLGALGLLQVAGGSLGVDFWHNSYQEIEDAFNSNPNIDWQGF